MKKNPSEEASAFITNARSAVDTAKMHGSAVQSKIIEGLAMLVESRDLNTGEHIQRTGTIYAMITDKLIEDDVFPELEDETYATDIKSGSALHDIGKIFVSDVILNKPGRLSPQEFEIIKTHTSFGAGIIDELFSDNTESGAVQAIRDIVLYHHEKWDGSGYPEGLKGDEIPLAARIMAVADVFDALLSKRPYKKAFSINTAYSIIEQDAGSHFDKRIVNAFIDIRPEVEAYLGAMVHRDSKITSMYSQQIQDNTRRVNVVNRLVDEYESIYTINLETEEVYPIKASVLQKDKDSQLSLNGLLDEISATVRPKDKKHFMNLRDVDYIKAYINQEDRREFIFGLGENHGGEIRHCSMHVTARSADNEPIEIAIAFMKMDDERSKNIILSEELERNYGIIQGLASEFLAVYYVNLDENYLLPYSHNEGVERILVGEHKDDTEYDVSMKRYVEECVHPDYRKSIREALDPEFIRAQLDNLSAFSRIYLNDGSHYRRLKVVKVGEINDRPNALVVGFIDNDEIYRSELENLRKESYISGLTEDYEAVFHVNADAMIAEAIKITAPYASRNPGIKDRMRYRDFLKIVSQNMYPGDRREYIQTHSLSNIKKQFEKNEAFYYNYRIINDEGVLEYHQLKIIHTSNWQTDHTFLIGVHNVDNLIKSEMHRRKLIDKTIEDDIDDMTQVYNRSGFAKHGSKLIAGNSRKHIPTYIMYFDVKHLDMINQTYGRQEGDRCMIAISGAIQEVFRDRGIVGRVLDDEFGAVITCRSRDNESAGEYFKRAARGSIERFNASSTLPYDIEVTLGGFMLMPGEKATLEESLKLADKDRQTGLYLDLESLR